MSDNLLILDAASVNQQIRTTDDAGVQTPHHIVATLESGVPTPVSATAPLPVYGPLTDTELRASSVAVVVDPTFPVVVDSSTPIAISGTVSTGGLTDAELRATAVPVSLPALHVTSFPAQHIDAFSRVRTANPAYRFDSQFTHRIDTDLWDSAVTGDGAVTHDADNRMVAVVSGATAGANTAILESHYHSPYTPGRGQLVFITFNIPDAIPANGQAGVGYYDGINGIFLKSTASGVSLNITTSTDLADVEVAQASWNIDPLDGTGPSGITLDTTKTCILIIQLQALYVGRVTIGFDIGGQIVPVHTFDHANISGFPYIASAALPVRYWANTSTDATAATINAICASVISEGGQNLFEIDGRPFAAKGTNADVDTLAEAVVVIRAKSTLNSVHSDVLGIPLGLDVTVEGSGCWIEIRRNATVTASTPADVDTASAFEVLNSATVTADTGTLVDTFFVPASATIRTSESKGLLGKALLSYSHLLASGDNLAIMARDGTNSTVRAAIKWKEIR